MSDTYSTIDCCSNPELTNRDEKTIQYFDILSDDHISLFTKIFTCQVMGKECECDTDLMADLLYLFTLMNIIQDEKENDALNSTDGFDLGADYYRDKYNIECIREHFMCRGIDIVDVLKIYDLERENIYRDGIDYMIIESSVDPINRVRGPSD